MGRGPGREGSSSERADKLFDIAEDTLMLKEIGDTWFAPRERTPRVFKSANMKRQMSEWIASVSLLLLLSGFAHAQGVRPGRPTVSPYLNLLRRGTDPALNYYNLVRPQNEFINSIQQLQGQVSTNRQGISDLQKSTGLPPTGHTTRFLSHSSYFLNAGSAGRGSGQGGAPVVRPQAGQAQAQAPRRTR